MKRLFPSMILIGLTLALLGCTRNQVGPAVPESTAPPARAQGITYQMHYVGQKPDYEQLDLDENPCLAYAVYPTLIGPETNTAAFNKWISKMAGESAAIALDCLANPDEYQPYMAEEGFKTWKYQQMTTTTLTMSTRGIFSGWLYSGGYPPGAATNSNIAHLTFTYDAARGRFLTEDDIFTAPFTELLDQGLEDLILSKQPDTDRPYADCRWVWMLAEDGLQTYAIDGIMDTCSGSTALPWTEIRDLIRWDGVMGEIYPEMVNP